MAIDENCPPQFMSRGEVRRRWLRACVSGELVGFIPPALTGAAMVAFDAPELVLIAAMVIAGIGEGVILGAAQNRAISELLPAVSGWTRATATAAGLAWLAGMGGSSLVQAAGLVGLLVAVPAWTLGLLSMGFLQSRRLNGPELVASRWWRVTTFGWLLGVMVPVFALSVIPNGWPLAAHLVAAITGAVAMGAIVAAVSAPTLIRLVEGTRTTNR